jgi:succinate dehydrogenase / fumarate reductase, cytochrome b subunit
VKSKQPVNLDLTTIKFPLPAITSILHRISGVLLFLLLPVMLGLLGCSLHCEKSYMALQATIASSFWMKALLWVTMAAVLYHLVAGIRHLLMDVGIGETTCAAKASAVLMLIVFIVLAVIAGVWLW